MIRILGIDPGSRTTGFGVLQMEGSEIRHITHGVILLDAVERDFPERMLELGQSLEQILQQHRPDVVVIEKIFMGKNADSAFKLGHARGVVMFQAGIFKAKVAEYATRIVKKSITGNGGAEKQQVQMVMQALLKVPRIAQLDASDALALAYHHACILQQRERFQTSEKEMQP